MENPIYQNMSDLLARTFTMSEAERAKVAAEMVYGTVKGETALLVHDCITQLTSLAVAARAIGDEAMFEGCESAVTALGELDL